MRLARTVLTTALAIIVLTGSAWSVSDEKIAAEMYEQFDLDTSVYRIEVLSNQTKTALDESLSMTIHPITLGEPLGLFSFIAEIDRNGNLVERAQVKIRIRKFADVLVTTDRIKRHDEIEEAKCEIKRMDVTSLREQPIASFQQVEGYRSKRNLQKGTVITSGQIEPVPDIEVGREVSIVYDSGLCRITVPGRSMESGSKGDIIKIKNKSSGRIIVARVIDGSSVAVQM